MSIIWLAVAEYGKNHSIEDTDIVARKLLGLDWNESQHPRGKGGLFAKKSDSGGGFGGSETVSGNQTEKQVREYLATNPPVNKTDQAKHVRGTAAFENERARRLREGRPPQSEVSAEDLPAIGKAIREKMQSGDFDMVHRENGFRLMVSVAEKKGTAYNGQGEAFETSRFCVPISLHRGWHFYPVKERGSKPNETRENKGR